MNRQEFILATAVILFAAFVLGWFASWLVHRLTRPTRADMGQLEEMAQQLHEAEEARDTAVAELETREAELSQKLAETRSELRIAMDGLNDSRIEVEELRDYIEKKLGKARKG